MRLLILIFFSVFISSCLKLDSNLYNKDNTIKEYQLDNFTGTQDFILDASYNIPANLITIFPLQSQAEGESKASTIQALYIGDVTKINTTIFQAKQLFHVSHFNS